MEGSLLSLMHLDSSSLLSLEIVFTKVKQNQRPVCGPSCLCMQHSRLSRWALVFLGLCDVCFLPTFPTAHLKCPSGFVCFVCLFCWLVGFFFFFCTLCLSFNVDYSPKDQLWPVLCSLHYLYPMRIFIGSHLYYVFPKGIPPLLTHFKIPDHISITCETPQPPTWHPSKCGPLTPQVLVKQNSCDTKNHFAKWDWGRMKREDAKFCITFRNLLIWFWLGAGAGVTLRLNRPSGKSKRWFYLARGRVWDREQGQILTQSGKVASTSVFGTKCCLLILLTFTLFKTLITDADITQN